MNELNSSIKEQLTRAQPARQYSTHIQNNL